MLTSVKKRLPRAESSTSPVSIVESLLDGHPESLVESVEAVLNVMCGSELAHPNGLNETGLKAIILSSLRTQSQDVQIVSEQLIQDVNNSKVVFFADLIVQNVDRSRVALLEIKYVPINFVQGNYANFRKHEVIQRRTKMAEWKSQLKNEVSLDDIVVTVAVGDDAKESRTILEHSQIAMTEQAMKYWHVLKDKYSRQDNVHLYSIVSVGNRVHTLHEHYQPPKVSPRTSSEKQDE